MNISKDSEDSHGCSYKSHQHKRNNYTGFLFPLTGLACLIWFLVRVIPKPSRSEYPCMKVAAPMAGGFIIYIIGLISTVLSFKKARLYFANSKYTSASVFIIIGIIAEVRNGLLQECRWAHTIQLSI